MNPLRRKGKRQYAYPITTTRVGLLTWEARSPATLRAVAERGRTPITARLKLRLLHGLAGPVRLPDNHDGGHR